MTVAQPSCIDPSCSVPLNSLVSCSAAIAGSHLAAEKNSDSKGPGTWLPPCHLLPSVAPYSMACSLSLKDVRYISFTVSFLMLFTLAMYVPSHTFLLVQTICWSTFRGHI